MELKIKNIGKIESAQLKLDGITVIAGKNNTGKSTIGKSLYGIFNGMSNLNQKIFDDRINAMSRVLSDYISTVPFLRDTDYPQQTSSKIFSMFEQTRNLEIEFLEKEVTSLYNHELDIERELYEQYDEVDEDMRTSDDERLKKLLSRELLSVLRSKLIERMVISNNAIQSKILYNQFMTEFGAQILNNEKEQDGGTISLSIKQNQNELHFTNKEVIAQESLLSLKLKSVYIDNPFILDEPRRMMKRGHQADLQHLLSLKENMDATEEVLLDEKLEKIYSIFKKVSVGELVTGKNQRYTRVLYQENGKEYSLSNVSLGLKTFIILKTLIQQGHIMDEGTIILDEPEIHLHPEWQIMFAELIVLLQKNFNLHILITTHSPYFLEAIEVYSNIHEIDEKCAYYLNENIDGKIKVTEVSDSLEKVYSKFFLPFQELENLRKEY